MEMMQRPLTEGEKAVRDEFVSQYLVDYNGYKACLRVGFLPQYAIEFSEKFLNEPYVAQEIQRRLADHNDDVLRKSIVAALHKEMQCSPSPAARVAAATKLASLMRMDPAQKIEQDIKTESVQFYLPSNGRD